LYILLCLRTKLDLGRPAPYSENSAYCLYEKLAGKLCLISQHTQRPLIKSISEVGSSAEIETLTRTFCSHSHNFYTGEGVKSAKFRSRGLYSCSSRWRWLQVVGQCDKHLESPSTGAAISLWAHNARLVARYSIL